MAGEVLESLLYYAKQPVVLREVVRRAWWHVRTSEAERASERREAEAWCRARAEPLEGVLQSLESGPAGSSSLVEAYPVVLEKARRRAAECPFRMGGGANLDLLYGLCEALAAKSVVETGVAYGWSTLAILLSLRQRPEARLYSVDFPYLRLRNDDWIGVAVPPELRGQWRLIKRPDRKGLPEAIERARPIDLAHYDSDKRREARLWAYPLLWDGLRPGGLLVSDDIADNTAFQQFSARIRVRPVVIADHAGDKFQGLLRKPSPGVGSEPESMRRKRRFGFDE